MAIRLTLPIGLSFNDWAHQILQDLEPEGLSPVKAEEEHWQRWATAVCQIPKVAGQNPPNPWTYTDWKVWSEHFIRSVY